MWWQESQRWRQFQHLRFAWLHNSRAPWDIEGRPRKKEKELEADADIWLINPEGVAWLYKTFYDHRRRKAGSLPFDTIVVDELTKFKNAQAQRSKQLRAMTYNTHRLWGLTGSPTPNGYEDLFGQMLLLDGGVALGKYYSHFRDKYFKPDGFTGFQWKLAEGADKRIEEKIAHMVLRISAADWLDLPKRIDRPIRIALDDKARAAYDKLKKEMLLDVPEGQITAANSAALYSKLAQLANGQVYLEAVHGEKRRSVHVHDAKFEALDDLVDELAGAPLLVTYEFNHDLTRLKEWYQKKTRRELRYLGKGTTDREASAIERDWNDNAIDILAVHPASSGHGLNFQRGGAQHICHFSATWDFELYDQVIQRILRQGNTADHVVNHLLLVENSIDELKYEALQAKDTTQARFLQAINTAFGNETPGRGEAAAERNEESPEMAFKLKTKSQAAAEQEEAPAAAASVKKGWGKVAAKTKPAEETEEEVDATAQREEIQSKLRGKPRQVAEPEEGGEEDAPVDAKAAFSSAVQAALDGEAEEDAPAPKKTRAKKTPAADPAPSTVPYYPRRRLNVEVGVTVDADGNPTPSVRAFASLDDDFEEDTVVRIAELAAKAAEAAFTRLTEEEQD